MIVALSCYNIYTRQSAMYYGIVRRIFLGVGGCWENLKMDAVCVLHMLVEKWWKG